MKYNVVVRSGDVVIASYVFDNMKDALNEYYMDIETEEIVILYKGTEEFLYYNKAAYTVA